MDIRLSMIPGPGFYVCIRIFRNWVPPSTYFVPSKGHIRGETVDLELLPLAPASATDTGDSTSGSPSQPVVACWFCVSIGRRRLPQACFSEALQCRFWFCIGRGRLAPATGWFPGFCVFWLGATGAAEAAATKRAQTIAVKRIVVDSEDKTKWLIVFDCLVGIRTKRHCCFIYLDQMPPGFCRSAKFSQAVLLLFYYELL